MKSTNYLSSARRRSIASTAFAVAAAIVVTSMGAQLSANAQDVGGMRIGDWDHNMVGPFTPMPEDQLVSKKYYGGLRHTETWFSLFLRNDAGVFRHLSNAVATPAEGADLVAGPWVPPLMLLPGSDVMVPYSPPQPWSGKAIQEITPDKKDRYVVNNKATKEVITWDERTIDWHSENGDIQLKGKLIAPAMQYLLHWRDPNGNTDLIYYMNQSYKVDGTFYGEHVTGYAMPEHMWGNRNYKDTWWVKNREGIWSFWQTEYDDGTFEYGNIMCGNGGSRAAMIVNSKGEQVLNTSQFNVAEAPDSKGFEFTFASGPKWQFVREGYYFKKRSPPFPTNEGTNLDLGTTTRVGETRKVVSSHSVLAELGDIKACRPVRLGQLRP